MSPKPSAPARAGSAIGSSKKTKGSASSSKSCKGARDRYSARCRRKNSKSESTKNASSSVLKWLKKNDGRGPAAYNRILGDDGGGGFLKGSTKVQTLKKGTKVFRYCGSKAAEMGGWWAPSPAGNPIRDLALPPGNAATNMVAGELKHDVQVLSGPGAPRCSNKPGGPSQFYVPYPPGDHISVLSKSKVR